MRKNAPRKWLHAILDLLPVILIPVFMIYSHRHAIDSGFIQVPQNEVVDFNQYVESDYDLLLKFSSYGADYSYDNKLINETIERPSDFSRIYCSQYFRFDVDDIIVMSGTLYSNDVTSFIFGNFNPREITSVPTLYRHRFSFDNSSQYPIGFAFNSPVDSVIYIEGFNIFNLTQMFGKGNEPTLEQFDEWYSDDYYDYTLSHKELLKDTSTITYDDTDIMSQAMYQLYNSVDKYFNMNNVFNMGAVYDWFVLNIFNGNAPLIMYIVWNIALYELVMDLMFLLYALFMWFVDWCKSLIERTYDVGRGK